ncbi:type II and III secretion system protein family protein [Marinomonas sp. TI.3.20]|uniref:type II and III secretion system protein family protein n=1 Tax=Marinomonas sp. TI.3.20 TaxID=3121296 RepID=UPI00311EE28C
MMKVVKLFLFSFLLINLSTTAWAEELMNLSKGDARAVSTKSDIGSVFISDPAVADYQVIDKKKVVVFAKGLGDATLMVFSSDGATLLQKHLIVNTSMVRIQQRVALKYPNADISIYIVGDKVVLSGTVATEEERDGINSLVGELLGIKSVDTDINWKPDSSSGTSQTFNPAYMKKRSFDGVVNNIEVATTKQINVKLTIAEVSHSLMENLGLQFGSSGSTSGIFANPIRNITSGNIIATITAINDKEVGQVLAEPNLSVISGESASFLVGGEMPITTVVDNQTNITYKDFGVKLDMTAKVMTDNKIRLSLMPEVSSVDTQYSDAKNNIPAFKTRRARTTVELGDGQSFVLGGLLNNEERELLRKIPFIGDIPILGSLFRYTETSRNKTELLIIATVNLVKPIDSSQVQLPTFERTSNTQRFFVIPRRKKAEYQNLSREILASGGFKK